MSFTDDLIICRIEIYPTPIIFNFLLIEVTYGFHFKKFSSEFGKNK